MRAHYFKSTSGGGGGGGTEIEFLNIVDKNLPALATTLDEDAALSSGITNTPVGDGNVEVFVNGAKVSLGNGAKDKDCYFAAPGSPSVAKLITAIAAGDILHWMGSIAGYQLTALDRIDFIYTQTAP